MELENRRAGKVLWPGWPHELFTSPQVLDLPPTYGRGSVVLSPCVIFLDEFLVGRSTQRTGSCRVGHVRHSHSTGSSREFITIDSPTGVPSWAF